MVVGAEKVIHRIKGAGMRSCDRLTRLVRLVFIYLRVWRFEPAYQIGPACEEVYESGQGCLG